LVPNCRVEEVLLDLDTEDGIGEIGGTHLLLLQVVYINRRHAFLLKPS
jgi:hypothetical protein